MKFHNVASLLFSLFLVGFSGQANAWFPHGSSGGGGIAPVLQSVSVPFGLLTRSGFGDVRLSSMDQTSASIDPVTFSGLDIQTAAGPPCAAWTLAYVSGRASTDYTIIAPGTAEGTSAITPVPSSTGQNAATGNYVWNVSCTAADGTPSNTVQLTYQGVANAVNYAQGDANFGVTPSGFGNVAGAKFLISTGTDFAHKSLSDNRNILPLGNYTNVVTVQNADPARPAAMSNITTSNNVSNVRVTGFPLSFTPGASVNRIAGSIALTNSVSNLTYDNITYKGSEAYINGNSALSGFGFNGCTSNCNFTDSEFDYVEAGANFGSNSTFERIVVRYIYSDCMNGGSIDNFMMRDIMCIAPMSRFGGNHTDTFQIADNSTPNHVTMERVAELQGDGDDIAQGIYFGGSVLGADGSLLGYVDDGTGTGTPGMIFNRVSGYWGSQASNSTVVIPGYIAGTDGVYINCLPSGCVTSGAPTQAQMYNMSGPMLIGSVGSPVSMYGVGTQNFHMSGIIADVGNFHGFTQGGNNGTSWMYDFSYTQATANPYKINTFQGNVTGNVLTATTTATTNLPANTSPYISGSGRLNYPGCNWCSLSSIGSKTSGSDVGPGTWTLIGSPGNYSGTIQSSQAYPVDGAWGEQSNCNRPSQGGSLSIDRGWFQGAYFANGGGCVAGVNFPSSNTTVGPNLFGYAPNGTLTAADFASGMMPRDYLLAHPVTASTTPAQILAISCLSRKGKIGGKLDLGGGDWANAVTGETDAVNHTGGGDWIIFDGTNHVVSNHIPGCEVAP